MSMAKFSKPQVPISSLDIDEPVSALSLSPNGQFLAVTTSSATRSGIIWDIQNKNQVLSLAQENQGLAWICEYSANGLYFLTSSSSDAVIWDAKNYTPLRKIDLPEYSSFASFINDKFLLVSSHDRKIRLWDIQSGVQIAALRGHDEGITGCFSVGENIVSTSYDKTLRIWDIKGECLQVIKDEAEINFSGKNSTGRYLFTFTPPTTIKIWRTSDFSIICEFQLSEAKRFSSATINAAGDLIAFAAKDASEKSAVYHIPSGEIVATYVFDADPQKLFVPTRCAFLADNEHLAIVGNHQYVDYNPRVGENDIFETGYVNLYLLP
jgi:WD40 repeat protein